jgi:hypothetical protein
MGFIVIIQARQFFYGIPFGRAVRTRCSVPHSTIRAQTIAPHP